MKKALKTVWRPALVILLIYILFKRQIFDLKQIALVMTNPLVLTCGTLTLLLQSTAFAVRWQLIIDLFEKVSLSKIIRLHFIGLFFNYYIPSGVGGDILKAIRLSKESRLSKSSGFSTVIADRVFGLFGMILISSILLTIYSILPNSVDLSKYLLISCGLLLFSSFGLLFFPNIVTFISPLIKKSGTYAIRVNNLTEQLSLTIGIFRNVSIQSKIIGINLLLKISSAAYLAVVLNTLDAPSQPLFLFFTLSCFALLASSLPIFPAGVGVGQYAFFLVFSIFGSDYARGAVTAITTLQIFNLIFSLLGGVLFSFEKTSSKESS